MFNTTKQTRHEFTYPAGIQSSTGGLSLPRAVYIGDPQIVQHLTALKIYTEVVYYIIRGGIITHLTEWSVALCQSFQSFLQQFILLIKQPKFSKFLNINFHLN